MAFGRMRCLKSMTNNTIIAQPNSSRTASKRLPPKLLILQHEHDRGRELDQRIHRRDRCITRAAPTAKPDVAQDGNVVGPSKGTTTCGTVGARSHHRYSQRQPMDAYVEKAPDRQTEGRQYDNGAHFHHRGNVLGGATGSGRSRDWGESVISRCDGTSTYACPRGSTGGSPSALLVSSRHDAGPPSLPPFESLDLSRIAVEIIERVQL